MLHQDIRDLLYLDFEKAASIWSQFEGGLREKVSISDDVGRGQKAAVSFGIPKVAEANLGVDYTGKRSVLESKILHHDVLNSVDNALTDAGLVVDLMTTLDHQESNPAAIREAICFHPYVKASGASVIEDYPRILGISEKFNEIVNFISECSMQSVKQSPEYKELQNNIETMRLQANGERDRNKRSVKTQQLKSMEATLQSLTAPQILGVEKWLLNGIKLWINTFMASRINFRVYPFPSCPSFQVLCNLKRDCFVDQDPEHLLYGYGNRPNVPLTVFGLLTSIPDLSTETAFDPMAEFQESADESAEQVAFERGFRAIFSAMDNLEAFMRYSRYPNVTVHPIAVYRSFVPVAK
ncbi:hypothetical protein Psta_0683 [Pirellula staleyi DSM 6068]|uniref:Uncharacterized protein n=1 Tax=Pirellula staleyi (strain ATCC 27377 / DSM 6068 / ICPB 4128) TaxID=530564 RepID=D2R5B0_PIRSD|nr:hypothetical protein [Pirellula staleyi]ADB15369.1 hypothetical protein Psta_0683 [Pirellula staleyi DSM 6068]